MHLITSKYLIANKFLAYCYGERNSKHKPILAAEGGREVATHLGEGGMAGDGVPLVVMVWGACC